MVGNLTATRHLCSLRFERVAKPRTGSTVRHLRLYAGCKSRVPMRLASCPGVRDFAEKIRWCCWGGLNSRPHPYQGCALPLSYSSVTVARCLGPNFDLCKRNLDPFLHVMYGKCMERKTTPINKAKKSASSREDRLKAALKANMGRRKAQARARAQSDAGDSSEAVESKGQD